MMRLARMRLHIALRIAAATVAAAFAYVTTAQQVFDSPEAAADALIAVAKSNDEAAVLQLFGRRAATFLPLSIGRATANSTPAS